MSFFGFNKKDADKLNGKTKNAQSKVFGNADELVQKMSLLEGVTSLEKLNEVQPALLESLGKYAGAEHFYFFSEVQNRNDNNNSADTANNVNNSDKIFQLDYEWKDFGAANSLEKNLKITLKDIPNWSEKLLAGEEIIVRDFESEKTSAPKAFELFGGKNANSLIIIPLIFVQNLQGFMIFVNPKENCGVSFKLLRSIGEHILNLRENLFMKAELVQNHKSMKDALDEVNLNSEIIGTISKIYSIIYRLDLENDYYEEISAYDEMHRLTGKCGYNISEAGENTRKIAIAPEYQDVTEDFFNIKTLADRLFDTDSLSVEYRTASGSWHLARFIVKKRNSEGKVTNVLFVVRQIDKEKALENQYKEKIFANSIALAGLRMDYTIAFTVNLETDNYEIVFNHDTNNARENSNITKFSDYVKRYADTFVLPDFRDSMKEIFSCSGMKKRFETENDFHYTFETIPNGAGQSHFQAHIIKENNEFGNYAFLGFSCIDEVVKQERYYRDALQKANDKLKNQLDMITFALPGGIKISNDDPTYSFKYVSEQFAKMLGYSTSAELMEASGGSIVGLVHPDDLATGIADALDQYKSSNHYATTYRVKCKDGSFKYVEDRGQKVISPDGTVEHWNLILDKNDLMEKTIALESEKKASRSKSDFLSRMSHDMRTPLNGIIGLLKINQDHFDDTELVKENYAKMKISADHLLSLINDVLQMSKIEDGNIHLTHEVIDFEVLSKEIWTIIEERAVESGIELDFQLEKNTPFPFIYGSPVHLRQIFLNIYGNCIKYNHFGGKITTKADFFEEKPDYCKYRWTITDTGIGMDKEFLQHIFEPFVQAKDDARTNYNGNGLGLAIVKGLIEKMGGTISVTSEEGVGSTFVITIPFEIAPIPTLEPEVEDKIQKEMLVGYSFMLVEDNDINANIAQLMLGDQGADVTVVRDGKQAVDLFSEKPAGTFDAILMDVMMPVMDGLEATKTIRAMASASSDKNAANYRADAASIPIIAMTANAFKEDEEKCLASGMNAHLAKPLDIQKIIATIKKFCKK